MQLFFEAGIGGIINKYVLKSTAIQSTKSELWKFFEISSTLFACTTILSTVILMFVLLSFISSSDMMTKIWLTLTVFFNGISFYFVHFRNYFESMGQINSVQKVGVLTSLSYLVTFTICVFSDLGLFSLVISGFVQLLLLFLLFKKLFYSNFKERKFSLLIVKFDLAIPFLKENRILILRNFGSNLAGFFIFQFFTLVTFQLRGPIEAGKVGFALQIFQTLNLFSSSFIYDKIPKISLLLHRGINDDLYSFLRKIIVISVTSVIAIGPLILFGLYLLMDFGILKESRFLDSPYFVAILFCSLVVSIMQVYSSTVRVLLHEPYTLLSVCMGLLITVGNWLILKSQLPTGSIFLFFLVVLLLVQFPIEYKIFNKYTRSL
jgi:O-antigen/teichoic acid export membrane protein